MTAIYHKKTSKLKNLKLKRFMQANIDSFFRALCALFFIALLSVDSNAGSNPFTESFECRTIDPVLGGGFKPNCKSRWLRKHENNVIFDINFSTDEFGRRTTPRKSNVQRTANTLFFGCSFTLGAGVNDNETLPYYYSQNFPSMNVYNYGGSGFGPQQILAVLADTDVKNQVAPATTRTIGIYVFLNFHVQRAVGKPSVYNNFGKYFPYYELDESNQLIHKGTFISGRPIRSKLYDWINSIPFFATRFEILNEAPSEQDILVTARIIEESSKSFFQKFASKDFFVLIYPGSDRKINSKIKLFLENRGIKYFDYSDLVDMNASSNRLKDAHPSAATHRTVASHLVQDLRSGAAQFSSKTRH